MENFNLKILLPAALFLIILSNASSHGSARINYAGEAEKTRRAQVKYIYTREIGVKELTGKNDGKRVEEYLKYTGLSKGHAWCAAFVCWVLGKAGIENPRSGWSPDLVPSNRIVWQRNGKNAALPGGKPACGDVFGIWFPEKNRIAHVGFIDKADEKYAITVEGNTNLTGSREGDGVYRKRRLLSSIQKVANWIEKR